MEVTSKMWKALVEKAITYAIDFRANGVDSEPEQYIIQMLIGIGIESDLLKEDEGEALSDSITSHSRFAKLPPLENEEEIKTLRVERFKKFQQFCEENNIYFCTGMEGDRLEWTYMMGLNKRDGNLITKYLRKVGAAFKCEYDPRSNKDTKWIKITFNFVP